MKKTVTFLVALVMCAVTQLASAEHPKIEYEVPLVPKTTEIKLVSYDGTYFIDAAGVRRLLIGGDSYMTKTSSGNDFGSHKLPPGEGSKIRAYLVGGVTAKDCKTSIELNPEGAIVKVTVMGCNPVALGDAPPNDLL